MIEARVAGAVTARVTVGHPCRAEVDSDELLVGADPLVAQVGNSRWEGEPGASGTTLRKDGAPLVRIQDQASGIDVFDVAGIVLVHVARDGAVTNSGGAVLRRATAGAKGIQIGDATVTGTTDAALAAVLTAPELIPEVRALAACHHLFAQETK